MFNKAIVMGRLTVDPELRQTAGGIPVTSFSIAVNRAFVAKGTGERQVDFLDIVAWRTTAEFICRYFTKGRPILVEGSIQVRNYVDKAGNNRRAWEIVAENAYFADSRPSGDGGGGAPDGYRRQDSLPQEAPTPAYVSGNVDDFAEIDDDGDLPF